MAILTEQYSVDQIRHYSNKNLKLRQIETGIIYDDAVDLIPCIYTYEETDQAIEESEEDQLNNREAITIITNGY